MPHPSVDAAFKAKIASGFTTIPTIGVGGVTEPPASGGGSFVVIQYPVVNGSKPSLSRRFFEEGAARIVFNVEKGLAEVDAQQTWIPTVSSLFREKNSMEMGLSGLQTFAVDGPISNDAIDDGNFVSYSLIVPYRYQFND